MEVVGDTLKLNILNSRQLKYLTYHYQIWWLMDTQCYTIRMTFFKKDPAEANEILLILIAAIDREYKFVLTDAGRYKCIKHNAQQ